MTPTKRLDEIALRLNGRTDLHCDDDSMEQYNDLLRLCREFAADLTTCRAELAAAKRDAERYRIARNKVSVSAGVFRHFEIDKFQLVAGSLISGGQRFEAAIDAAIKKDET